jgi:GNAT superfamily N-acetyltransferase
VDIPDNNGKVHRFYIDIFTRFDEGKNKLIFRVYYKRDLSLELDVEYLPVVLDIDFDKDDQKNEYQSPPGYFSDWIFELPEQIRYKGIGSHLWEKVESFFYKYHVMEIRGAIGLVCDTTNDKKRTALFWKKMGFIVSPNFTMRKIYKRT